MFGESTQVQHMDGGDSTEQPTRGQAGRGLLPLILTPSYNKATNQSVCRLVTVQSAFKTVGAAGAAGPPPVHFT